MHFLANALKFHKITHLNHRGAVMAEQNVIIAMLDDFAQEHPIYTAICIGQDLTRLQFQQSIQWHHFSVSEVLNLPFQQRYDLAVVMLAAPEILVVLEQQKSQILVKMREDRKSVV